MKHKELFIAQVHKELTNYEKTCKKQGVIPTVRLNTISDIAYELTDIIVKHPNILFIDYTKRARRLKDVNKLHNYKVIFSYSGKATYQKQVEIALQYNNPVAVVFEKYLPKTFLGREVIDGDISDIDNALYSNDKIVGLKLKKSKGYQEFLNSGFVVLQDTKRKAAWYAWLLTVKTIFDRCFKSSVNINYNFPINVFLYRISLNI